MLSDGYELTWQIEDVMQPGNPFESAFGHRKVKTKYQAQPTDAGPVPLGSEITALEGELAARGYAVALNHYRQAVDNFRNHQHEAANSQLRTALEDLLVQLAEAHAGYTKTAGQGGGWQAIEKLTSTASLNEKNGGLLLQGFWKMGHTDGSHPGTSNADESRFRLQVMTACTRLLLHRFPPKA